MILNDSVLITHPHTQLTNCFSMVSRDEENSKVHMIIDIQLYRKENISHFIIRSQNVPKFQQKSFCYPSPSQEKIFLDHIFDFPCLFQKDKKIFSVSPFLFE